MTRDEFLSLPPTVALRVLLDAFPSLEQKLAAVPKPDVPKKPRFDFSIFRKDGLQWASETDLEGLIWWRNRYQESASNPDNSKYAAKDAKRVKNLDAWIAWRRIEPSAQWSGKRDDETVTAAPPDGRPRVYPRGGGNASEESRRSGEGSSDNGVDESY